MRTLPGTGVRASRSSRLKTCDKCRSARDYCHVGDREILAAKAPFEFAGLFVRAKHLRGVVEEFVELEQSHSATVRAARLNCEIAAEQRRLVLLPGRAPVARLQHHGNRRPLAAAARPEDPSKWETPHAAAEPGTCPAIIPNFSEPKSIALKIVHLGFVLSAFASGTSFHVFPPSLRLENGFLGSDRPTPLAGYEMHAGQTLALQDACPRPAGFLGKPDT